MENKHIWVTVLVSFLVAVIASVMTLAIGNNMYYSPQPMLRAGNVSIVPAPDLVSEVAYMSGGCGGGSGGNVTCSVGYNIFVRNVGNAVAGPSTTSTSLEHLCGSVECDVYEIIFSTPYLAPGQGAVFDANFSWLDRGNYSVETMADVFRQVRESNENNNGETIFFTL